MGLKEIWGIVTGSTARANRAEAERIQADAEERYEKAHAAATRIHKKTEKSLVKLGKQRLEIAAKTLPATVEYLQDFVTVGKIDIQAALPDDVEFSIEDIELIQTEGAQTLQILAGGAAGSVLGVAGAWGAVTTFGVASTGTAISTLAGAAATKAGLAALGGGALSAGGAGIAGGMALLGGIAFVPLAIASIGAMTRNHKRAEEALTNAVAFAAEVDEKLEELELLKTNLKAIIARCAELSAVTDELVKKLLQAQGHCQACDAELRETEAQLPSVVEAQAQAAQRLEEVRQQLACCVEQLADTTRSLATHSQRKETAEQKAEGLQARETMLRTKATSGFFLFRWWYRFRLSRVLSVCQEAQAAAEATRQSWQEVSQDASRLETERATFQDSYDESVALAQEAAERVESLQHKIEALLQQRTNHVASIVLLTKTVHRLIKIPALDEEGQASVATAEEGRLLERSA
jgi:hypothetical protein